MSKSTKKPRKSQDPELKLGEDEASSSRSGKPNKGRVSFRERGEIYE